MIRHSLHINRIAGILAKENKSNEEVEMLNKFLTQNEDFNKLVSKISKTEKIQLLKNMSCKVFSAGEVIFSKGDTVSHLFIVLRGSVDHISYEKGVKVVSSCTTGKQIGDRAYMKQPTRTTACVSVTDSLLLSISIDTYRELLGEDAHMLLHKKMKFIDQYFPGIRKYSFSHRERIAHKIDLVTKKKNNVISVQGEISEIIYFLCEGEVVLTADYFRIPILKITPGSCIGEETLIGCPNEYTSVVSSDQAVLYAMEKNEILQYVPDETKEAWKHNYLLKTEERKRLNSNVEMRRQFLSASPRKLEFSLASPQAKKHLTIVSLRYNLASSHKDLRETKSFQDSKKILNRFIRKT